MVDRVPCSLENDVFPVLASSGRISANSYRGFFIDIGVPEDLAAAPELISKARTRPAVFFDRDGVLNYDRGYTHKPADLVWNDAAIEAVKSVNDAGWYAFVITNQAGVARGYYSERAVDLFHETMDVELANSDAHIDEFRFSPFHPEGRVEKYRVDSPCRKPKPGMILELSKAWPIDLSRSVVIGDKQSDMDAAHAAGVHGQLYSGGNLNDLTNRVLRS
nr:HAD-IIIA family hydrolase [Microvirga sp. HBU67558]